MYFGSNSGDFLKVRVKLVDLLQLMVEELQMLLLLFVAPLGGLDLQLCGLDLGSNILLLLHGADFASLDLALLRSLLDWRHFLNRIVVEVQWPDLFSHSG